MVCHTLLPIHSSLPVHFFQAEEEEEEKETRKKTEEGDRQIKTTEGEREKEKQDERERVGGERARKTARLALLKYNGVISREENEGRGVSFKREVFLSVLN